MITLSRAEARCVMLGTIGPRPLESTALVATLGCIQVDPIDRIGNNPDLVAFARTSLRKGEALNLPGFEHYAKEWCKLPADVFPWYEQQARRTPTWRHTARMEALDEALLADVEAEILERGALSSHQLTDRGTASARNHAWSHPAKRTTLALNSLALRARVVVVGRSNTRRVYAPPSALGPLPKATGSFSDWALPHRVKATGLMSRRAGPWWSMLKAERTDGTIDQHLESGSFIEVSIDGLRGGWLTTRDALDAAPSDDATMTLLGPLDPLIWNRDLVQHLFDFRYVWEIYKPAAKREWGYYVLPLLHHGSLVGRLEGHVDGHTLVVDTVWRESETFDEDALSEALDRHAEALGCDSVQC